jgi:HEAT repeat protein
LVLVDLLLSAQDPIVWNAAAIALRDLGDSRAVSPILTRLADPITDGARGTLIYALGAFDCASHIETLVDFVVTGNYEVSREAASIIESIESPIPPEIRQRCVARLQEAVRNATSEQREVLGQMIDWFEA